VKKFNITVNGSAYEVEIEEVKAAATTAKSAPKAAPAPVKPAAPAPAKAAVAPSAGETAVNAPMPGKIVKLVANEGAAVKAGDVLLILEAMKMQNEITAPSDGTVKAFNVAAGQSVKAGEVLVIFS
jgi:biotin carboxyl carrier protein